MAHSSSFEQLSEAVGLDEESEPFMVDEVVLLQFIVQLFHSGVDGRLHTVNFQAVTVQVNVGHQLKVDGVHLRGAAPTPVTLANTCRGGICFVVVDVACRS